MQDMDNRAYYERRAKEERDRANQQEDNSAALAHLKMADAYEQRIQAIDSSQQR